MLEAEGRPRREHHAVFFGEPVGELEGGHVELVAQEGQQPAPRRRPREEVGALLDEAVCRLKVLADDLAVTLDDAISVLERQDCQCVAELARAQGDVVTHAPAFGHYLCRCRHPSDTQPRQAEGLGDGADADGRGAVVDSGRREGGAAGNLEPPVGLVAEDPSPHRLGQVVDAPELLLAEHGPRGVVRGIEYDQTRAGCHQALQLVQVVAVALEPYLPQADVGSYGAGHAVELLVGGVDGHDVVTRIEQDVKQQEVGLDGARGDEDVLRRAVAVGVGEYSLKLQRPRGRAVAERGFQQPLEKNLALLGFFEGEQIVGGEGQDAALCYVVGGRELVGGHPTFKGERLYLHGWAPSSLAGRHGTASVYPQVDRETLFTEVPRRGVLGTSAVAHSRKFATR